jgi:hypothetical protein
MPPTFATEDAITKAATVYYNLHQTKDPKAAINAFQVGF